MSLRITAIYIVLGLITACVPNLHLNKSTTTAATEHDEIIFFRDGFVEYKWKQYEDTVKVKTPQIVGVEGIYNLEYKLNINEIKILKHQVASRYRKSTDIGELLYESQLSKQQRQGFKQIMSQVNLSDVRNANVSVPNYVVEDGFQLDVLLTKAGVQERIFWNNKYVKDLVSFLIIANDLSPEKYKFYRDKEAFMRALKQNTKLRR